MPLHPKTDPAVQLVLFGLGYAALCPGLHIPSDGSSLVQAKPLPKHIKSQVGSRFKPKECFYNSATLVWDSVAPDAKYVVGFAAAPSPIEHAWVKVGDQYHDPTWEYFDAFATHYLPFFELDRASLVKVMSGLDTQYPPALAELLNWANRNHPQARTRFHTRPTGSVSTAPKSPRH